MRWVAGALAALVAALVLALAPMTGRGVEGTPVEPRYTEFSFAVFGDLPAEPTDADLRAAGVALPQDAVRDRRHAVLAAAGVSALLLLLSAAAAARSRRGSAAA